MSTIMSPRSNSATPHSTITSPRSVLTSPRSASYSKSINKRFEGLPLGTDAFRLDNLEANSIILDDEVLDEERWTTLAFSLGIPTKGRQRASSGSYRVAQKMKKRKAHSDSQTFDIVNPFIESLVTQHSKLSRKTNCQYWCDAVPTREDLRNTVKRLPTPAPSISIGYKNDFSTTHEELMTGLIAGLNGEPCDLQRVSQPVPNHFWPFLVVEISDQSMDVATQASAVSTATCNNAVALLSAAAADDERSWTGKSSAFDDKFARSFSLSIHGKTARLSTHGPEGPVRYVSHPIANFQLDNEIDVAILADRIHSILVWANYNRLEEIVATLDQLGQKVHGRLSGFTLAEESYEFDPAMLKMLTLQALKRPARVKVALRAGLPRWMRLASPGLKTN